MTFNRFRVYDVLQRSVSTFLFATTVVGTVFIGANVYNNWVEKKRLRHELAHKSQAAAGKEDDSGP